MKFIYSYNFLFLFLWLVLLNLSNMQAQPYLHLANLEYSNPNLKQLRNEIKTNLRATHSSTSNIDFTELKYYEYKVKKNENFFLIMTKTSMDMDTLMSINDLTSPYEIFPGQKLKIPNMRGILYNGLCESVHECKKSISTKHNIEPEKLIYDHSSEKFFIPGGKIQDKEKKFFLGKVFEPPLESYRLTSKFGRRNDPFTKRETFHGGIDLASTKGSSVYASADGIVEFAGNRGGYGNLIIIKHDHGYETRYGHLLNFLGKNFQSLRKGMMIRKGDAIGQVGMTGRATGYHLHFEVRRFNKSEKPILR